MHKAYGFQNILDEEITEEMINYAIELDAEKAAWDIWISLYPDFTEDAFIPFSDFIKERIQKISKKETKNIDEIIDELSLVVDQYETRKRGE